MRVMVIWRKTAEWGEHMG